MAGMDLATSSKRRRGGHLAIALLTLLSVTGLALLSPTGTPAASAVSYGCLDGGYPSRSFNVKYGAVNDTWKGFFDTARSRWNKASVGANIGKNSGAAASITAGNYKDQSWYGTYAPTKVLWKVTKFSIKINATTLNADAPSGYYTTWILSTSTHEFGHALRLKDNPNTSSSSLMKHNRNRSTIGSPTSYDVANVKACY